MTDLKVGDIIEPKYESFEWQQSEIVKIVGDGEFAQVYYVLPQGRTTWDYADRVQLVNPQKDIWSEYL